MKRKDELGFFKVPSSLEPFISACKKIEEDWNYKPNITNQDLMNLVRNENGTAKHSPRRSALAIQPAEIKTPASDEPDSVGMIYQIKAARYGDPFGYDGFAPRTWYIDSDVVILVRKNGETSLCAREDAEKGIFNSSIERLKVEDFLNQPSGSLHQSVEASVRIFNFNNDNSN